MVLRNPIAQHNIIGDPAIARFNEQTKSIGADQGSLELHRENYRQHLLAELFNLNGLKTKARGFEELIPDLQKDILDVAEKFTRQLTTERTAKAAFYFSEKLKNAIENLHKQITGLIGNSKEKAAKADQLIRYMMARLSLMEHFAKENFTAAAYLAIKKNAQANATADQSRSYVKALNAKPNEKLFNQILSWRDNIAEKEKIMPNMVLSEKTIATIAEKLPEVLKALSAIKGVGPQKVAQYGPELISLVRSYQKELQGPEKEQGILF
jgi:superfamily II DNA helicase RecQ